MSVSDNFNAWLSRRHPIHKERITLDRRRIYILPTAAGWGYALSLFVMLLWAINYNNSIAFAFTFLLTAVAMNSMWRAHNTLLGIRITPLPCAPVFAGDQAGFHYRLEHSDTKPRFGIGLHWRGHPVVYTDVLVGGSQISVPIPALARGWLRAGPLRISTRFPFGLFQAWSWLRFEQNCLIYPKPAGDLPVPVAAAAKQSDGAAVTESAGQDDYAGLKTYVEGDSPRHIAWRASARSDYSQLQVKWFAAQADNTVWLDWDSVGLGDHEARLSQMTRWVLIATGNRQRFGLRLPDQQLLPAAGADHRHKALQALALHGGNSNA